MKMRALAGLVFAGLAYMGTNALAHDYFNAIYTYSTPSDGIVDADVEQHEFRVGALIPIVTEAEDGYDLSIGATFQYNGWLFSDDTIDDIDLYKVRIPIVAAFEAADDLNVALRVTPGIHSDWEDVDIEDMRIEARLVGTYVADPDLHAVQGVGFSEDFGDVSAFPIAGVHWRAAEDLVIDAVYPRPRISYRYDNDLRFFATGEPAGGQWNVGSGDDEVDVQIEGYRIGIGAEYQVVNGGWLYAMVGSEMAREFEIAVDDDPDAKMDVDDDIFLQIGFMVR